MDTNPTKPLAAQHLVIVYQVNGILNISRSRQVQGFPLVFLTVCTGSKVGVQALLRWLLFCVRKMLEGCDGVTGVENHHVGPRGVPVCQVSPGSRARSLKMCRNASDARRHTPLRPNNPHTWQHVHCHAVHFNPLETSE